MTDRIESSRQLPRVRRWGVLPILRRRRRRYVRRHARIQRPPTNRNAPVCCRSRRVTVSSADPNDLDVFATHSAYSRVMAGSSTHAGRALAGRVMANCGGRGVSATNLPAVLDLLDNMRANEDFVRGVSDALRCADIDGATLSATPRRSSSTRPDYSTGSSTRPARRPNSTTTMLAGSGGAPTPTPSPPIRTRRPVGSAAVLSRARGCGRLRSATTARSPRSPTRSGRPPATATKPTATGTSVLSAPAELAIPSPSSTASPRLCSLVCTTDVRSSMNSLQSGCVGSTT